MSLVYTLSTTTVKEGAMDCTQSTDLPHPNPSTVTGATLISRLLPSILAVALLIVGITGCGGTECEQVVSVPGGFEMTCIHECGMVLQVGASIPGPSCEWERRVCQDRCAIGH